jgi:hypothetical protein
MLARFDGTQQDKRWHASVPLSTKRTLLCGDLPAETTAISSSPASPLQPCRHDP